MIDDGDKENQRHGGTIHGASVELCDVAEEASEAYFSSS